MHGIIPAAVRLVPTESSPGDTRRRLLMAYPQALFRGDGLWLWGADETTLVHNIKSGQELCFIASCAGIPGLYFEAGLAFEEFEKLIELGEPRTDAAAREQSRRPWVHERLKAAPKPAPHQRIRMPTTEIGHHLVLDVEGPLTHAVIWGQCIR